MSQFSKMKLINYHWHSIFIKSDTCIILLFFLLNRLKIREIDRLQYIVFEFKLINLVKSSLRKYPLLYISKSDKSIFDFLNFPIIFTFQWCSDFRNRSMIVKTRLFSSYLSPLFLSVKRGSIS